ncbi:acyl-CoA dehydrogenase family protein [Parvularcula maris]|uniref:Acyl-CoA dehydrogenase family protein n=1 Tax=Parvularcula maris TaxID=2965077 RepID=A0A9X2L808_9PROT|nr:acyl-CoA dehydrogenase family protein [Parvularcula maris]MCQ8184789.1 acyl-CoA dehydrogenase family protein [Parvularcula maris]
MHFEHSDKTKDLIRRVEDFMSAHVWDGYETYKKQHAELRAKGDPWQIPPVIEELKDKAKDAGLWNMFLPDKELGAGLTNLEYAPIAEVTGKCHIAPEVFNCAAPDTGNMEVLYKYGTDAQKEEWLMPLLDGKIRSAFLMTEPAVASSDATNIECRIERDGDEYVINGRKWWSSGAGDPRCAIYIVMGKTDPSEATYKQQSMILVPANTPGITVERHLPVFGYDDAPHGHMEVVLDNVRVPASNMLLGEGRGFEIAQGRLGPGRIHHCMRTIGAAERALEAMVRRLGSREAFGKPVIKHSIWEQRIGEARINIEMTRLLCLKAAWMMDTAGNKAAKGEIAMIKVAAPNMCLKIIDDAIQAHGGAGVSDDFHLAEIYAHMRTLRLADGPDEVHNRAISRLEAGRYFNRDGSEVVHGAQAGYGQTS